MQVSKIKLSRSYMRLFCLRLIHRCCWFFHFMLNWMRVQFLKDFSRHIVPKVTWQLIGSWPRVLVVVSNGLASSYSELPCQAVFHSWNHVSSIGRKIHLVIAVRPRAWHFVCENLRPTSSFTEVPRATVFVFWKRINSFLVDCKSHRIGAWSRNLQLLLVFLLRLLRQGVSRLWKGWTHIICPWSRILIYPNVSQRTCSLHLFSTFSEPTGESFGRREGAWDFISVGRGIFWGTI